MFNQDNLCQLTNPHQLMMQHGPQQMRSENGSTISISLA